MKKTTRPQKNRRGRPRIPLDELADRWNGPGRAYVERHKRDALAALFDEMLAFLPGGIVDDVSLAWFVARYQSEIPHVFRPPFAPALTPEGIERRDNAEAIVREIGRTKNVMGVVVLVRAKLAFHAAQMHAWRRNGSTGTPPLEPDEDDGEWFERETRTLERFREAATGRRAAQREDGPTPPEAGARPGHKPPAAHPQSDTPAEEMPDLGNETSDRPVPEDWADHVTWDGKEQTMSPRDMIRPHLEAIGRLDLLDQYSDEIIQYGPIVRRWIGGKLR